MAWPGKEGQQNHESGSDAMHDSGPNFPEPEHGAGHVATCPGLVMKFFPTKGPDLGV